MSLLDVKRKEFTSQDIKLITKIDCLQVIQQTLNLDENDVIDYSIERAGGDVFGFLGEYFRLKITTRNHIIFKETGELTNNYYFVKSLPFTNKPKLEMMTNLGFFRKESTIYGEIFTNMKGDTGESKWRPYSYLVRDDIFILEELRHEGYRHLPDRTDFPEEHILISLTSIARMHASSYECELKTIKMKIGDKYKDILFETLSPNNTWLMAGMHAAKAIALIHPKFSEKYFNEIENNFMKISFKIFDLINPSNIYKNVLTHRDLWANNLMFKYSDSDNTKPEKCLIIDYQSCRYSPPALDVLLFLYFNTRRKNREENLKRYLDFYYKQLKNELEKYEIDINDLVTREDFNKSCDLYKLVPIVLSTIYVPLTQLPTGFLNDLQEKNLEEYNLIVDHDRSDFVLNRMEIDTYYKDYLNEVIGELIEFIIS